MRRRYRDALRGLFFALLGLCALAPHAEAESLTRVFVNGTPISVYFNDGDSFRMYGGPYAGRQARLGGFNTLESFGPAHAWGDFHPYEMYALAKRATAHGRRGVWHCTTDGEADTYGRLLLDCPDLAISLIRYGLAHAMEVEDQPSRPEYLRAQQQAIRERRGMWAKGVPDFVLTSTHSTTEDPSRDQHYNRLVSSRDGHSEPWSHNDAYADCDWVCNTETRVDPVRVREVARGLRSDRAIAQSLRSTSNLILTEIVVRYARTNTLPPYTPEAAQASILAYLAQAKRDGRLGETHQERGACMLYVDFTRRYGRNRASCLHGHGVRP